MLFYSRRIDRYDGKFGNVSNGIIRYYRIRLTAAGLVVRTLYNNRMVICTFMIFFLPQYNILNPTVRM